MTLTLLLAASGIFSSGQAEKSLPFVSPTFGDHMVLQRGKKNRIWGWTTPGAKVTVTVASHVSAAETGSDGKWMVSFDPPKVGGPYEVKIDGSTSVTLHDVMVGDVWLCTGQSNMEFGLTMAKGGQDEAAAANNPNIRLFKASKQIGFSPRLVNGGIWKVCTPETVAQDGWGGFSAVGYYFGKEIQQEEKIPVGLVECDWGGTSAEAWTSEPAIRELGDFNDDLDKVAVLRNQGVPVVGTYLEQWIDQNDPGISSGNQWQSEQFDDSGWTSSAVPDGFNGSGIGSDAGLVWFRREVVLPDPLPSGANMLSLGRIHNVDSTYINGKPVGGQNDGNWPRNYWLDDGTLHAGKNEIAVRVYGQGQPRGFVSPPEELFIRLGDGSKIPLASDWKAKIGFETKSLATRPKDGSTVPTVPAMLYNGMIAPLAPLAIKGVIWYQGETNGGRGYQYRKLLPAMIADWRKNFQQPDFSFYIVSLANFMQRHDTPGDDNWAELREAQAMTASNVKHSGLALAIDIGDAADIHPKDKATVGHRLALNALALDYGKKVPFSGPVYQSFSVNGNELKLRFNHADGGLAFRGDADKAFAVAGSDHQWHWAQARIEGKDVVLKSADVASPVAARYAWQSNPPAPLYNGAGLPAVPFRTDDWKEISQPATAGR